MSFPNSPTFKLNRVSEGDKLALIIPGNHVGMEVVLFWYKNLILVMVLVFYQSYFYTFVYFWYAKTSILDFSFSFGISIIQLIN